MGEISERDRVMAQGVASRIYDDLANGLTATHLTNCGGFKRGDWHGWIAAALAAARREQREADIQIALAAKFGDDSKDGRGISWRAACDCCAESIRASGAAPPEPADVRAAARLAKDLLTGHWLPDSDVAAALENAGLVTCHVDYDNFVTRGSIELTDLGRRLVERAGEQA